MRLTDLRIMIDNVIHGGFKRIVCRRSAQYTGNLARPSELACAVEDTSLRRKVQLLKAGALLAFRCGATLPLWHTTSPSALVPAGWPQQSAGAV